MTELVLFPLSTAFFSMEMTIKARSHFGLLASPLELACWRMNPRLSPPLPWIPDHR